MLPRSPPLPFTHRTFFVCAVERIDLVELGAGVAAAEVGDAQVGAKQVRPVAQQLRRIQLGCDRLIPAVFKKFELWPCS